jgi:hypothetical protein
MSASSENTGTGLDSPPAGRLFSSVMTRLDKSESWREFRPQGDGSGQPTSAARGAGRGARGAGRAARGGHPAARRI